MQPAQAIEILSALTFREIIAYRLENARSVADRTSKFQYLSIFIDDKHMAWYGSMEI
jgi:hypothetical protein